MKYVGKYGEHRVLAKLYELQTEAYLAIKTNQEHYDITAILSNSEVVRIQVKTTTLGSESTNNSIKGLEKDYHFLVIVVVEKIASAAIQTLSQTPQEFAMPTEYATRFFVLSKAEMLQEKGTSQELAVSWKPRRGSGIKEVRQEFLKYEDAWLKILFCS